METGITQPAQKENNEKPQNSEKQLTLQEIEKEIKHYWKQIDLATSYIPYKEAFDKLDYYRDLKQKLYK